MGKFGIGARVVDSDGDVGVIVDKRKGEREVNYDRWGCVWVDKSILSCLEKGEIEYSDGGEVEKGEKWVPKVGDRVRFKSGAPNEYSARWSGGELTVDRVSPNLDVTLEYAKEGITQTVQLCDIEPITAPLKIEAGRFYKTRDGRKVGPMEVWDGMESYPGGGVLCHAPADHPHSGEYWRSGGENGDGHTTQDVELDLIAEWVEPEVAVAKATATPKFKVGDRVVIARNSRGYDFLEKEIGKCPAIDLVYPDGSYAVDGSNYWWPEVDLDPAPTNPIPIGSTVTFTATGRLSAINENGHMQVTFPGLEPDQNSFALPAAFVSLAN